MDEKINLQAVDQYSETFANRIIGSFFSKKERITGPEILSLCEIKQVNLLIIRELMRAWKLETQKLKSPFFDYQAKEVTTAMLSFQNTLSNHISISRNDFFPLLKRAASQTLFVILDPYDFYSDTLDQQGESRITVAELKNDIKYLKINRQPLERLVQKMEEKKLTFITGNEAFALLDSILEEVNFTPEDLEAYISQFSKVVALQVDKLYDSPVAPPVVEVKSNTIKKPTPIPAPAAVAESKTVVNDLQKIGSIKDNLTINQKFMFTKILFNGDFEIFSHSIDRLDSLDNYKQALNYLDTNYAEWDKESEEYLEFMEMLEKRFS